MGIFDFDNPFYRPLGVRIAVVVVPLAWAAFEFIFASPYWGVLFGAAGLFAFYKLFLVGVRPAADRTDTRERKDG